MAKGFRERVLNIYSNFMKFTITSTIFNMCLTLIENMPVLYAIDAIFDSDILSSVFTPFYFLCPTIYLELFNEKLTNECNVILTEGYVMDNITINYQNQSLGLNNTNGLILINQRGGSNNFEIKLFNTTLISMNKEFCLYSRSLTYLSASVIFFLVILFIVLAFINPRKESIIKKLLSYIITNFCNLVLRPFGVIPLVVLFNKPLLILYKNQKIIGDYFSTEIVHTIISVFFIIIFCILNSLYIKYINNCYFFEKYPYDYYSKSDGMLLLVIKIFVALKINFDKIGGLSHVTFVNLILGILIGVRFITTISNRKLIINNVELKGLNNYLATFFLFYIVLKLINQTFTDIRQHTVLTLVVELLIIVVLIIFMRNQFFTSEIKFTFCTKDEFIEESLHFLHYIGNHIKNEQSFSPNKINTESIIDNIIIGHKMKCILEDCILCPEDIYNPNLKTLFMILYQQYLRFQKELREEDEEISITLRLLFLKMLDEKKIHRISFVVLKNTKLELPAYLKVYYLYHDLLDEINNDLRNLLTIKYGEIYDELLQCIGKFEEILGFIKSRTEKVEQVINKTNQIGTVFNKLIKDLYFLKKNKRIFFDPSNMLQIVCVIRLLFQRNVDFELTENLQYNFLDFLENIDRVFEDNRSFLVRYDFNNYIWRIKKVPKLFIDLTKMKISDLIDQSIDKVFPYSLGKNIVKKLEELLLSNILDTNLTFKTFVCDSETNVKYVKFDIDIVPNLDKNYILLMHCHFHKRQLLIVDEFGNFVNGSESLYKKMGINSEIVSASKGKINMYNVFNLPKTTKLDEVKIVSISDEGLVNTTKKVFLLETNIYSTTLPGFLNDFVKNDNERDKKKERNVVYMNLFDTIPINEVKYYVFTIKISGEDKKKTDEEEKRKETEYKPGGNTIKKREESFNSSVYTNGQEKEKEKKNLKKGKKSFNDEESRNPYNLHTYQNCLEYYNYFYDTHKSASVTIDYNKNNMNSHNSSQGNSANSDLFSFLYIRSASNKKRSNKFENFLLCIYIFNFALVILGLISIIFLNASVKVVDSYVDNYFIFNKFRTHIYSTTCNFFSVIKLNKNETDDDYNYNDFIKKKITPAISFDFDYYIKTNMKFHAENMMIEMNNFLNSAYSFFGQTYYYDHINYKTDFIYFNSIGNYMIRQDSLKNAFGLFSLTSNEFATSNQIKTYLNTSFVDFRNDTNVQLLTDVDKFSLSTYENNYFQSNINIYQYFYNYFSVFYKNLNDISSIYTSYGSNFSDDLQAKSKALLIVIVILNIIFVLISFFSILIYRRILLKEFNTLYSFNEEHLNKLKEKYKYVRELIKLEHNPSKIYNQLRKMKELEIGQFGSEKKEELVKKETDELKKINKNQRMDTFDDVKSVMTNNETGIKDVYLKFAGAKSALLRSTTIKVKKKIEKIKKENYQARASMMLLQRLNFEFELITKFIYFIAMMSIFYLVMGIFMIFLLAQRFDSLKVSLYYTDLFFEKHSNLYNYYISVKLSIMFNKVSPYTIPDPIFNQSCKNCNYDLFTKFNNVTEIIHKLQATFPFLDELQLNDKKYEGSNFCNILYDTPNDLIDYLKANSTFSKSLPDSLKKLCKNIPILQSNIDSVFSNINENIRDIYDSFIDSDRSVSVRIDLLEKEFRLIDILFGIFAEPYLSYIKNNLLVDHLKSILNSYSGFIVAMLSVNIMIDFLILFYIWFKIYKQIISSVNNIHLVTDSVSTI